MLKTKFSPQFKWPIVILILLLITAVTLVFRLILGGDQKIQNLVGSEEELTNPELANETDVTSSWAVYIDEDSGFSFKHPNLDEECCMIGGPASEEVILDLTLGDPDTVTPTWNNDPFAGIGVYVVETDKLFDKYISDEKKALLEQDKEYLTYRAAKDEDFDEEFVDNGYEEKTTLNGQEGVILINYSWDEIERYYIPFPNSNKVLVLGRVSQSIEVESSKFTFDQLFSTFKFTGQQP